MGGLGTLAKAIEEILLDYGIHVPSWIGLAIAAGLIVLFLPNIIKNAKVEKARRDMTRLHDLTPEARDRERERILDMANDHPVGLVAIADEALRKQQTAIARGAVERLRRTGKRTADLQRLERARRSGIRSTHSSRPTRRPAASTIWCASPTTIPTSTGGRSISIAT